MAFSLRAGTHWCHDFPKLARESGFYFNIQRTPVRVDWNRLNTIDIDRVIRERDFLTIDENVNNVVDYSLESTYDVKILDSNFVKIFRLAQLSIEYLLYCRQYLDQSVIILKDDLRSRLEENHKLKKELALAEESIKELKDKSREKYKLIEKKLSDSHGEIHKCPHCPKTFISSVFVSSHVTRRHSVLSLPQSSPMHDEYRAEAEKLHNEIKSLKERLNETERVIRSETCKFYESIESSRDQKISEIPEANQCDEKKFAEQHEKYREEINNLKSILFSEIRKLKRLENPPENHELNNYEVNENFNELIKQQENEIQRLRDQLQKKLTPDIASVQLKLNAQENYWQSKIQEIQLQHRADIDKLYSQLKLNEEATTKMKNDYINEIDELKEKSVESKKVEKIEDVESPSNEESVEEIKFLPFPNDNSRNKWKVHTDVNKIEIQPIIYNDKAFGSSKIQHFSGNSSDEVDSESNATDFGSESDDSSQVTEDARKVAKSAEDARKVAKSAEDTRKVAKSAVDARKMAKVAEEARKMAKVTEDARKMARSAEDARKVAKSAEEIRWEIQESFNQRLKDLGIDPDWRGIPQTTYRQLVTIIAHHRSLKTKKYRKFEEVRRTITQKLLKKIPKSKNLDKKSRKSTKFNDATIEKRNFLPEKFDKREFSTVKRANDRYVTSPRSVKQSDVGKTDVKLSHSYESIDWIKNSANKTDEFPNFYGRPFSTSTPQVIERQNGGEVTSSKNSRSVIKTVGSSVKKKVLFDLQSVKNNENSFNSWNSEASVASVDNKSEDFTDSDEVPNFSGKLTVKTTDAGVEGPKFGRSEKIMEIARKIDQQLSLARQKPVGGVEAMFLGKFGGGGRDGRNLVVGMGEEEIKAPQPKPRTVRLSNNLLVGTKEESEESNLDLDIDELLRME